MKNLWVYIRLLILLVFTISSILAFISRDYVTTLTSEPKSTNAASPSPQETATVRIVENPDGSRNMSVEVSLNIRLSASVSGQFFDTSKYENYILATEMMKETLNLLRDIWDQYSEWITLFVTVLSFPIAIEALISKKTPFLM